MESILTSTKKILGYTEEFEAFDQDIITFINGALSTAEQAGVGLTTVFAIEDKTTNWEDLGLDPRNTAMLKNYVYLKARLIFDPPPTSFGIEAMQKQIEEFEVRMQIREEGINPYVPT